MRYINYIKHIIYIFILYIIVLTCPSSAFATFTAPGTGDHCYGIAASGTSANCILTNAPTTAKVVLVHIVDCCSLTLSNVTDGTTTYTLPSTHCSATNDASAGTDCVAYLIPTITGGQTITANFTGGTCAACSITVDEFGYTGGTVSFDAAAAGNGTGAITTPNATVTGSTDLIWGGCTDASACNGVTGSWTAETNNAMTDFGEAAEYQLNVSSTAAVGFAGTAAQVYDSMGLALKLSGGATTRSTIKGPVRLTGPVVVH